eukprot:Rmarinus@m.7412
MLSAIHWQRSWPFSIRQVRAVGSCCVESYFTEREGGDTAFSLRSNHVKFGFGVLKEVGHDMKDLLSAKPDQRSRIALFTDVGVRETTHFDQVHSSLKSSGFDVVVYDEVRVEPTDLSMMAAADFARHAKPDAYVSVGGGSVMDTTKAAMMYAERPPPNGNFLYYVNAPVGEGVALDAYPPLSPHIACPTTSGTGSECTGFAICTLTDHPTAKNSKTGIVGAALIPTMAVIDPAVTHTLPRNVLAASGFDVLGHALESFTARPYTHRTPGPQPHRRPLNQGANPFSDFACVEALKVVGRVFSAALLGDPSVDPIARRAREEMMWASTVVGTAMGNAGVHLAHGLSYPASGSVPDFRPSGYPSNRPILPHGMGVGLCAPAVFRATSKSSPHRHALAANFLGAMQGYNSRHENDAACQIDAGEAIAETLISYLRQAEFPNGLAGVGFTDDDLPRLTHACFQQKRVVDNAPMGCEEHNIRAMYEDAMKYW